MADVSPTCKPIEDQLEALVRAKKTLTKDVQEAAPAQKPHLLNEIRDLDHRIGQKRDELEECMKKHPAIAYVRLANPCIDIEKEIEKLQIQLAHQVHQAVAPLQEELKQVAGSAKAALLRDIRDTETKIREHSPITAQIHEKRTEYKACLIKNGGFTGLDTHFKGKATLKIDDPNLDKPFHKDVNIGLHFSDWDRRDVRITSFPDISETYSVPVAGEITTTISLLSAQGSFDPPTGTLTLDCSLFFHHSTSMAGDSKLHIKLQGGSKANGDTAVSGVSYFDDGKLDNRRCTIDVDGKISPAPTS